ncbi:hypothetical protein, partial [Aeromonas dhakensis]
DELLRQWRGEFPALQTELEAFSRWLLASLR